MGVQKSRLRLSENFPLKITKAQSFSQTEIKLHPFWLAGDKGAKMTSHGEGRLVGGESTKQGYLPPPILLSSGKTIFIAGDAWFLSGASLPGSFGRSLGAFCHCQYCNIIGDPLVWGAYCIARAMWSAHCALRLYQVVSQSQ